MTAPDWWQFALLAAAAWRTYHLLANDEILDRPRRWLVRLGGEWQEDGDPVPDNYRAKVANFLTCPYCFGAWCALAWWAGWLVSEKWSVIAAVPFALSASVAALAAFFKRES